MSAAKRRGFLCWLFGCRWVRDDVTFIAGSGRRVTLPCVKCSRCGRIDNP